MGLCATACAQNDPGWWSGVIRSGETPATDNYAPANLGQLKNFASHARDHLDELLTGVGGAGSDIQSMVDSWPSAVADNYAPINLGQLKAVADKFYTRLDAVPFDYKSQLIANGYAGVWTNDPDQHLRPWNEAAAPDTNYAPANLGQLKILFSFDLTGFTPGVFADANQNGLPDTWEHQYWPAGLPSGFTPEGDEDGDGVSNASEYFLGTSPISKDSDNDGIDDGMDDHPTIPNPAKPAEFRVEVQSRQSDDPANSGDLDYTSIKLEWSPVAGAVGYFLERSTETAAWTRIATLGGGQSEYPNEHLLAHQHYQYRLTAYKVVNGEQILSKPCYLNYEVNPNLRLFGKSLYGNFGDGGFRSYKEYITTSGFPKFYRTETFHYEDVYHQPKYYYENRWVDGSSGWTKVDASDTYLPPNGHTMTGTYSDSNTRHGPWLNYGESDDRKETFDYSENFARTKDNHVISKHATNTITSHKKKWDKGTHGEDLTGELSGTGFQQWSYEDTAVPDSTSEKWVDYTNLIAVLGKYSYAGFSSNKYDETHTGTLYDAGDETHIDDRENLRSDGTYARPHQPWEGYWGHDTAPRPAVLNAPPSSSTYRAYSQGDASNGNSGWSQLSDEYTLEMVLADAEAQMDVAIPWDFGYWYRSGPPLWQDSIGCRYLWREDNMVGLQKSRYKWKTSPSVPYRMTWLEVLIPSPPEIPSHGTSTAAAAALAKKELKVLQARSWDLTDQENETPDPGIGVDAGVTGEDEGTIQILKPTFAFEPVKQENGDDNVPIEDNAFPTDWDDSGTPVAWQWMPGGGFRIFPDAKTPADATPRNEVDVKVGIGVPGVTVYLKVIDVDDPTPDKYDVSDGQHIVDPGDNGGESGNDNKGAPGKFVSSDSESETVTCVTDESGIARIGEDLPRLKVGMKAGDNYRIAVAFQEADLGTLQVTSKTENYYVPANGEGVAGFKGDVSPLLTVWRRLNLEVDTMDKVTQPKPGPDHVTFTNAHWISSTVLSANYPGSAIPPSNDHPDFYQGGYVQKGNKKTRITTSKFIFTSTPLLNIEVRFEFESHPNIAEGDTFDAYDDDDRFLDILGLNPPLPMTNRHAEIVEGLQSVYNPAYIQIVDADQYNVRKILNFELNSHPLFPAGVGPQFDYDYLASKHDLPYSTPQFWTWLVVIAYQGDVNNDEDPVNEYVSPGVLFGETLPAGTNSSASVKLSVIPWEVNRDEAMKTIPNEAYFISESHRQSARKLINAQFIGTIAHELAHNHSTGNDHTENGPEEVDNGLMQAGALPLDSPYAYFRAHTILRLRLNNIW